MINTNCCNICALQITEFNQTASCTQCGGPFHLICPVPPCVSSSGTRAECCIAQQVLRVVLSPSQLPQSQQPSPTTSLLAPPTSSTPLSTLHPGKRQISPSCPGQPGKFPKPNPLNLSAAGRSETCAKDMEATGFHNASGFHNVTQIPATPPAWFMEFATNLASLRADVIQRLDRQEARIEALESKFDSSSLEPPLVDSCKVLASGVPADLSASHKETVAMVLDALNLASSINFVVDPPPRSAPSLPPPSSSSSPLPPSSTIAPPGPTDQADPASAKPPTSLVARFSSTSMRDLVVSRSSVLKDKYAQDIFGAGGQRPVHIRPL